MERHICSIILMMIKYKYNILHYCYHLHRLFRDAFVVAAAGGLAPGSPVRCEQDREREGERE